MSRRGAVEERGFTLVEVLIATAVLVIIMAALGPTFYGALRLTSVTDQRSQASNLAVEATEQMRSLPYADVGFFQTPAACTNNSEQPVTLAAPGPLDSLPQTSIVGHTTFTVVRCVYWSASSMPGTNEAYKQTLVKVSWAAPGGALTVSQSSALYPGSSSIPGSSSTSVPTGGTTTTSTTTTIPQTGLLTPSCSAVKDASQPSNTIDLTISSVVGASYYIVYYTTTQPTGAITAGSSPYITVQANNTTPFLKVGAGTTYWIQVAAVASDGTMSSPSSSCTATTDGAPGSSSTTTTTTYSSNSSATALYLALAGSTVPYVTTSSTASNSGSGSNTVAQSQPTVSIPGADSFLKVAVASQYAEADTAGPSFACAGVLSSGQSLSGGSSSAPCSVSGTGTGGVYLNLAGLPGVGSAINSIVAGLTLNLNGATSWAGGNAGGTTLSGSAVLSGGSVTVTALGGLVSVTVPLNLPATLTSPTDIVKAITTAIGTSSLASVAAPLQTALSGALTMTGDYQSTSGGKLTVSALHIVVLSGAGTGDLAQSTVGQNASSTTSQTTYTTPPCSIYSLVVYPSAGPGGSGGVALTANGNLADESSFQLAVNQSGGCTNVQVGYAPSGCVPGNSGCSSTLVNLTGTGGTLYGSAGSASTVWTVGTTTFTVFVGSTVYSPLAQQQVILCTEKGTTGKC